MSSGMMGPPASPASRCNSDVDPPPHYSNSTQDWYRKLCRAAQDREDATKEKEAATNCSGDSGVDFASPSPQRLALQLTLQREYQKRQELAKNCRQQWWQKKSGAGESLSTSLPATPNTPVVSLAPTPAPSPAAPIYQNRSFDPLQNRSFDYMQNKSFDFPNRSFDQFNLHNQSLDPNLFHHGTFEQGSFLNSSFDQPQTSSVYAGVPHYTAEADFHHSAPRNQPILPPLRLAPSTGNTFAPLSGRGLATNVVLTERERQLLQLIRERGLDNVEAALGPATATTSYSNYMPQPAATQPLDNAYHGGVSTYYTPQQRRGLDNRGKPHAWNPQVHTTERERQLMEMMLRVEKRLQQQQQEQQAVAKQKQQIEFQRNILQLLREQKLAEHKQQEAAARAAADLRKIAIKEELGHKASSIRSNRRNSTPLKQVKSLMRSTSTETDAGEVFPDEGLASKSKQKTREDVVLASDQRQQIGTKKGIATTAKTKLLPATGQDKDNGPDVEEVEDSDTKKCEHKETPETKDSQSAVYRTPSSVAADNTKATANGDSSVGLASDQRQQIEAQKGIAITAKTKLLPTTGQDKDKGPEVEEVEDSNTTKENHDKVSMPDGDHKKCKHEETTSNTKDSHNVAYRTSTSVAADNSNSKATDNGDSSKVSQERLLNEGSKKIVVYSSAERSSESKAPSESQSNVDCSAENIGEGPAQERSKVTVKPPRSFSRQSSREQPQATPPVITPPGYTTPHPYRPQSRRTDMLKLIPGLNLQAAENVEPLIKSLQHDAVRSKPPVKTSQQVTRGQSAPLPPRSPPKDRNWRRLIQNKESPEVPVTKQDTSSGACHYTTIQDGINKPERQAELKDYKSSAKPGSGDKPDVAVAKDMASSSNKTVSPKHAVFLAKTNTNSVTKKDASINTQKHPATKPPVTQPASKQEKSPSGGSSAGQRKSPGKTTYIRSSPINRQLSSESGKSSGNSSFISRNSGQGSTYPETRSAGQPGSGRTRRFRRRWSRDKAERLENGAGPASPSEPAQKRPHPYAHVSGRVSPRDRGGWEQWDSHRRRRSYPNSWDDSRSELVPKRRSENHVMNDAASTPNAKTAQNKSTVVKQNPGNLPKDLSGSSQKSLYAQRSQQTSTITKAAPKPATKTSESEQRHAEHHVKFVLPATEVKKTDHSAPMHSPAPKLPLSPPVKSSRSDDHGAGEKVQMCTLKELASLKTAVLEELITDIGETEKKCGHTKVKATNRHTSHLTADQVRTTVSVQTPTKKSVDEMSQDLNEWAVAEARHDSTLRESVKSEIDKSTQPQHDVTTGNHGKTLAATVVELTQSEARTPSQNLEASTREALTIERHAVGLPVSSSQPNLTASHRAKKLHDGNFQRLPGSTVNILPTSGRTGIDVTQHDAHFHEDQAHRSFVASEHVMGASVKTASCEAGKEAREVCQHNSIDQRQNNAAGEQNKPEMKDNHACDITEDTLVHMAQTGFIPAVPADPANSSPNSAEKDVGTSEVALHDNEIALGQLQQTADTEATDLVSPPSTNTPERKPDEIGASELGSEPQVASDYFNDNVNKPTTEDIPRLETAAATAPVNNLTEDHDSVEASTESATPVCDETQQATTSDCFPHDASTGRPGELKHVLKVLANLKPQDDDEYGNKVAEPHRPSLGPSDSAAAATSTEAKSSPKCQEISPLEEEVFVDVDLAVEEGACAEGVHVSTDAVRVVFKRRLEHRCWGFSKEELAEVQAYLYRLPHEQVKANVVMTWKVEEDGERVDNHFCGNSFTRDLMTANGIL